MFKKCKHCQSLFNALGTSRYCSKLCRSRWRTANRSWKPFICQECKRFFHRQKRQRFCSLKCAYKGRRRCGAQSVKVGTISSQFNSVRGTYRLAIKTEKGWVNYLRYKMEQTLGRTLTKNERVLPKDGDPLNAEIGNLRIVEHFQSSKLTCVGCGKAWLLEPGRLKDKKTNFCGRCFDGQNKIRRARRHNLLRALLRCGSTPQEAAGDLGVGRSYVYNLIADLKKEGFTVKTWKTLLAQFDKMVQTGRASVYDIAKVLAKLVTDPEYKQSMVSQQKTATAEVQKRLDSMLLGATITDLADMLKKYPKREQWERGSLKQMRMEAVKTPKAKPLKKKEKRVRHAATLAEVEALKQENKLLKQENESLKREVAVLTKNTEALQKAIDMIGEKPHRLAQVGRKKA